MSEPLFLILSGTYVSAELVAEFGRLPPCFLPNGTHRLYETQIAFAQSLSSDIAITLPESFEISQSDRRKLDEAGVRVLATPDQASLTEALATALRSTDHDGRLFVLFGDTLVTCAATGSLPDTFASGTTHHLAMWAEYTRTSSGVRFGQAIAASTAKRNIVAGFFDFADSGLLRSLAERDAGASLVDLLNAYATARPLTPITTATWLDFGHLHNYFRSRRSELSARAFNRVEGDSLSVRKTGTPTRKIYAEALWYQNLPTRLRPFVPHFIDIHLTPEFGYEMEYLHLPLLSELFCFSRLPSEVWGDVLGSCKGFLELCQGIRPASFETALDFPRRFFEDMIVGKTVERLERFSAASGLALERAWTLGGQPMPSLLKVAESLVGMIAPTSLSDICLWHGDFHFANIFYDFRAQRVKVVDPRGMLADGTTTMFGDARYDISKLSHSIIGMYDLIIARRFTLEYDGSYAVRLDFDHSKDRDDFVREYSSVTIGHYKTADAQLIAMVALLFLSMLPLHDNDQTRQYAMLANGLRLARMAELVA